MAFSFIHAADLHLDSPFKGLERYEGAPEERIKGATREAFRNLVDLALEKEVQFVLIAGDLFDRDWEDFNTGIFFCNEVNRLKESGIRVFLVAGNHDYIGKITFNLPYPGHVIQFDSKKAESIALDDLGVMIHGRSFNNREVEPGFVEGYPSGKAGFFNIGLLHTSATGFSEHEPYAPCTVNDLLGKKYQYWALGHIHKRMLLNEDPPVLFPGNIQGRHIREQGDKGCTLVTVDEGRVTRMEHYSLDVLRWFQVDIDLEGIDESGFDRHLGESLEAFLKNQGTEDGRLLAIRICLKGETSLDCGIRADLDSFRARAQVQVNTIGGPRMWLETVKAETTTKTALETLSHDNPFLAGLLQRIEAMDAAGQLEEELASSHKDLENKLVKYREQIPMVSPGQDSKELKDLLLDTRQILLSKLTGGKNR